jgi:iron(III) transport system permease protein
MTWRWLRAVLILALCAAPLSTLALRGAPGLLGDLLAHLTGTVLPAQLGASIVVATGTVAAATALASGGLLCGLFRFPGRRLLSRALLVPLLVPGWFLAVLYRETLGVTGTVALVLVLGATLAPLVHLLVGAALRAVPERSLDVLRHLGRDDPVSIARTLLPLGLPAFSAAAVLVFFVAWADEGSARSLAVSTLTVGLFDQWFGRQSEAAGAPLALAMLALCLPPAGTIWLWLTRGSFRPTARLQGRPMTPVRLRGAAAVVPWVLSAPLLAVGVLYPAAVIARWTAERLRWVDLATLGLDLVDSLVLAVGATALAALVALAVLGQEVTATARPVTRATTLVALTTFALPPLVVALAWVWMLPETDGRRWTAWLNATPVPLVAALGLRYCAVFLVAGRAALLRSARAHGEVLRVTGRTGFVSFVRLFRPFVAAPLVAVACLVALATLQDLSVSQVLQPFGFTTISSRVYQYAQSHRVADCAVWVLCQALVGVYPLMLLARWAEGAGARDGAR